MAYVVIAGFFILAIVGGVGLGAASADSSDDVARSGAFGFDQVTQTATMNHAYVKTIDRKTDAVFYEGSALASAAPRDMSASMRMADDMERIVRERAIADDAAALVRMSEAKAMQGVGTSAEEVEGQPPAEDAVEYSLPAVDWSVGHDAFMAEWTPRIDAYLAGSPLEGHGATFAQAAWDNGVDPRWSPAISNTESGKGSICFRDYNAWGWGSSDWEDWDSAIKDHVAGLGRAYGYSITVAAAQMYCPPNWSNWYADTLSEMASI